MFGDGTNEMRVRRGQPGNFYLSTSSEDDHNMMSFLKSEQKRGNKRGVALIHHPLRRGVGVATSKRDRRKSDSSPTPQARRYSIHHESPTITDSEEYGRSSSDNCDGFSVIQGARDPDIIHVKKRKTNKNSPDVGRQYLPYFLRKPKVKSPDFPTSID